MMSIQIIYGYEKPEKVRVLFSEYIQMLISNDESFKEYLDIQNYDEEINDLEKSMVHLTVGYIYFIMTKN